MARRSPCTDLRPQKRFASQGSVTSTDAHVVCFKIHSSSANSRAELRFSGSHWSILRMKRRKHARSSLLSSPLREVSRSSSVLRRGIGMPAEKTPLEAHRQSGEKGTWARQSNTNLDSPSSEKNLLLRFARASRLGGGGPRSAIISERWALPRYVPCSGSRPVNRCSPSKASQIYGRVNLYRDCFVDL